MATRDNISPILSSSIRALRQFEHSGSRERETMYSAKKHFGRSKSRKSDKMVGHVSHCECEDLYMLVRCCIVDGDVRSGLLW